MSKQKEEEFKQLSKKLKEDKKILEEELKEILDRLWSKKTLKFIDLIENKEQNLQIEIKGVTKCRV